MSNAHADLHHIFIAPCALVSIYLLILCLGLFGIFSQVRGPTMEYLCKAFCFVATRQHYSALLQVSQMPLLTCKLGTKSSLLMLLVTL